MSEGDEEGRRAYLFTDSEIVLIFDALEAYKAPPELEAMKAGVEAHVTERVVRRIQRGQV